MERISFYEALTSVHEYKVFAVKGEESFELNLTNEVIRAFENDYLFYVDKDKKKINGITISLPGDIIAKFFDSTEGKEVEGNLLTFEGVHEIVMNHIDFLNEEYGVQFEEGHLIAGGDISEIKLFSTFTEIMDFQLIFKDGTPIIFEPKTGYSVPIKVIEGNYPRKNEIAIRDVQRLLSAVYESEYYSVIDLSIGLGIPKQNVEYILRKVSRKIGALI